jgi:hypothetical protein
MQWLLVAGARWRQACGQGQGRGLQREARRHRYGVERMVGSPLASTARRTAGQYIVVSMHVSSVWSLVYYRFALSSGRPGADGRDAPPMCTRIVVPGGMWASLTPLLPHPRARALWDALVPMSDAMQRLYCALMSFGVRSQQRSAAFARTESSPKSHGRSSWILRVCWHWPCPDETIMISNTAIVLIIGP